MAFKTPFTVLVKAQLQSQSTILYACISNTRRAALIWAVKEDYIIGSRIRLQRQRSCFTLAERMIHVYTIVCIILPMRYTRRTLTSRDLTWASSLLRTRHNQKLTSRQHNPLSTRQTQPDCVFESTPSPDPGTYRPSLRP